jgi:hypothetical protein
METVRGLIGSEKEGFFNDPRVQDILRKHSITVSFEKVGSRAIAQRSDLKSFDFAHPAGAPAAQKIQQSIKAQQVFTPFFTPMVVASWKQLLPTLMAEGIVKKESDNYYLVDMPRMVALMEKGTRWKDLKDNSAYAVSKSVLISSTDVRRSNSGAMYLALASYVANGNNVVQSEAELQKVLPLVTSIFLKQGFQEGSSAGPFEDYVSMGIGKAPMVMVYEAQFLEDSAGVFRNVDGCLIWDLEGDSPLASLEARSHGGEDVSQRRGGRGEGRMKQVFSAFSAPPREFFRFVHHSSPVKAWCSSDFFNASSAASFRS